MLKTTRILCAVAMFIFITGLQAFPPGEPRPMMVSLDARDAGRRILHCRLVIPAEPGPLTLCYPKWVPGEHGPTGPISDLAGLKLTAAGQPLAWHRDELDMYSITCRVPRGAESVEVSLDFLSAPPSTQGFSSAASATSRLALLSWNQVLLYPKGRPADEIICRASLTLPEGWKFGTSLPVESQSGTKAVFAPVSLERLIDSPVLCGLHLRQIQIGPSGAPPHYIVIAAEYEGLLDLDAEAKKGLDHLVSQARALFGGFPYESYHFLVTMSNYTSHFGLEHLRSSDNRIPENSLADRAIRTVEIGLLPHEFVHAWNGKYRRPSEMATPDFQQPKATGMLWVYEGLTTYLGDLLTARSGLWTEATYREHLAYSAEWANNQRGRSWRPLDDTAVSAQLLFGARRDWRAWRRYVDFYREGSLIWFEIDATIRQLTNNRKSLDDFCRRFFAPSGKPGKVRPYTFEELISELNEVARYRWKPFLTERLTSTTESAPTGGIERSGWRVAYSESPSNYHLALEKSDKCLYLGSSVGMQIGNSGSIIDIIPGKPADRAGLGPGMKIVAVNSRRWSAAQMRRAVRETGTTGSSLELLVENSGYFSTHVLDYGEGHKYPVLQRDSTVEDLLSRVLRPLSAE